jgi:hypothetical protein
MHRVYNSAFMNMLRDEKNNEYRQVIKNTIEFDPEILKRYVNFMNNPDERTAADQFGKGDKYFGIALMMSTMPGLPMFGHGQVDGFAEKYGMEYRQAYWDEKTDFQLVERHERELAPLLRRRYLFAEVNNFLLYDLFTPSGHVDENVFAYSNRSGDQCALIIYHNKYSETRGSIRLSAAYSVKTDDGDKRSLIQRSLAEGLGLRDDPNWFTMFRDHKSGLEFIRNNRTLYNQGLYVELRAYQYYIFLEFRQVPDDEGHHYAQLESYLEGRSVPNIEDALTELFLQPIHHPFKEFVNAGQFQWLIDNCIDGKENVRKQALKPVLDEVEIKLNILLTEVKQFTHGSGDQVMVARMLRRQTEVIMDLSVLAERFGLSDSGKCASALKYLKSGLGDGVRISPISYYGVLFSWIASHALGQMNSDNPQQVLQSRSWIDEWLLNKIIVGTFRDLGMDEQNAWQATSINNILISNQMWFDAYQQSLSTEDNRVYHLLYNWLEDNEVQRFLQINRHKGILWFNKEAFDRFLWWMYVIAVVQIASMVSITEKKFSTFLNQCYRIIQQLRNAERRSNFQVELLLELVKTGNKQLTH